MKPKVPCQNCKQRQLHCHSQCSLYAEYRKQLQLYKEAENKQKELDSFLFVAKQALMKKGAQRMYYSSNRKAGNK